MYGAEKTDHLYGNTDGLGCTSLFLVGVYTLEQAPEAPIDIWQNGGSP
jgi:hypothetical protein